MARRAAKADANQPDIVQTFRDLGATVQHLHTVGMGCPDIIVGFRGVNYLVEIKDGSKPPSGQKLTPPEQYFFDHWNGQVCIVNSPDAAANLLNHVVIKGVIS